MTDKELFDLEFPECFCIIDIDSNVDIYSCKIVSISKIKSFRDGISETVIICKVAYYIDEWWRNTDIDSSQLFLTIADAEKHKVAFIDKQLAVIDTMKAKLEQSKEKN